MSRVQSLIVERQGGIERGTLMVASAKLTDAELAELLADPRVTALSDLSLHHNALTSAGIRTAIASPKLTRLANLNLSNNPIGDEGVRALAGSEVLDPILTLSLAGVGATEAGAQALAESDHSAGIAQLDLGFQPIGRAAPLLATPRKALLLQKAGIDSQTAVALLQTGQVATLKLKENAIPTLDGLTSVSPALTALDLGSCGLTDLSALATAPAPGLRSLHLDYNPLGDEGLEVLARATWLPTLEFLSAMGAQGGPAGRAALRSAWGERPGLTLER